MIKKREFIQKKTKVLLLNINLYCTFAPNFRK